MDYSKDLEHRLDLMKQYKKEVQYLANKILILQGEINVLKQLVPAPEEKDT